MSDAARQEAPARQLTVSAARAVDTRARIEGPSGLAAASASIPSSARCSATAALGSSMTTAGSADGALRGPLPPATALGAMLAQCSSTALSSLSHLSTVSEINRAAGNAPKRFIHRALHRTTDFQNHPNDGAARPRGCCTAHGPAPFGDGAHPLLAESNDGYVRHRWEVARAESQRHLLLPRGPDRARRAAPPSAEFKVVMPELNHARDTGSVAEWYKKVQMPSLRGGRAGGEVSVAVAGGRRSACRRRCV